MNARQRYRYWKPAPEPHPLLLEFAEFLKAQNIQGILHRGRYAQESVFGERITVYSCRRSMGFVRVQTSFVDGQDYLDFSHLEPWPVLVRRWCSTGRRVMGAPEADYERR